MRLTNDHLECEKINAILNNRAYNIDIDKTLSLLLSYLKQGKNEHKKAKIVLFLRKHRKSVNTKALAEALDISENTAKEILYNNCGTAIFPVTGEKTKPIKVHAIPLSNTTLSFPADKNIKRALETIKKATGKQFMALFEDKFYGNSYMLALAAALITQETIERYLFTGAIDASGNIIGVENLQEKTLLAKYLKKPLIHSGIFKKLEELETFLKERKVDIPLLVVLKKQALRGVFDKFYNAIKSHYNLESMGIFEIEKSMCIYQTNYSMLPDTPWDELLDGIARRISSVKDRITGVTPVFHIAILGPSAFAFCLGAMFGLTDPFVLYHYTNGEYKIALNFRDDDLRKLKQHPSRFRLLDCNIPNTQQRINTLAMVYFLASHQPIGDVKKFIDELESCKLATCKVKTNASIVQGNIPIETWEHVVQEMYLCYNKTKELAVNRRMFFLSLPVPLAFALGAVIGSAEDADVMHFGAKNRYFKACNLLKRLKR